MVRHGGSLVRRACSRRRFRNPGRAATREYRGDHRDPASGPLRHGAADQLRHLQGRLGGAPCPGHPRPGAGRRHGLLGQLLRRPRRPSTRRASTPTISWSGSRRRNTSSGRRSSLDDKASFGLDFGEIYKRSVIGVRVYGVPAAEKEALAAFFSRLNDDYHKRARNTEYHDERDQVRLPAPELRQDHRRGIQATAPGTRTSRSRARRFSPGGGWWRRPTPTSPPRWR